MNDLFATHTALDDVSIDVQRGHIFGLLGHNGAGKTTLIRIINHITAPDSGTVTFDGHPLTQNDVAHIGYLPEERGLYKKMKVGEQAVYLAQLKGLSAREAKSRLQAWFEKLDIADWWNKRLEELSKGMQQKVQFITTVVHRPPLLIFDEPFSGFDPLNADLLKREILELRDAGHTVIFSTHNMESVEELCDDIALISHSRVVLSGEVSDVRRRFRNNTYSLTAAGDVLHPVDRRSRCRRPPHLPAAQIALRHQRRTPPPPRRPSRTHRLRRTYPHHARHLRAHRRRRPLHPLSPRP